MEIPQEKLFYTIYKIVNLINGRFYIGRHATNKLTDRYKGGGKLLPSVRKKYGEENIIKYTLFVFYTENEMMDMEELLVDPKDPMTYNIGYGGRRGASDSANKKISKTKTGVRKNNKKKKLKPSKTTPYWEKIRTGEIKRNDIVVINGVITRTKKFKAKVKAGIKRKKDNPVIPVMATDTAPKQTEWESKKLKAIEHNKNIHKERARIRIAKKEEKLLMQAIGSPAFHRLKIAKQEANKNKITHF